MAPKGEPDDNGKERSKLDAAGRTLMRFVQDVMSNGVGPIMGSVAWAEDRLRRVHGDRYDVGRFGARGENDIEADIAKVISRLISESQGAAGSAGFVTGLGGFVTLPVSVPANITGALIINARLAGLDSIDACRSAERLLASHSLTD